MTREFAAVVFDMDGLLIDSEVVYREAWTFGAKAVGYPGSTEFFTTLIGIPYADCIPRIDDHFGPDFPMAEFERVCNARVTERASNGFPLKPGVRELLALLADMDLPRAVATSSHRASAARHLSSAGIHGFFDCIVGRDDVARGKPHPDLYAKATETLRARPAACLALEDSWTGVQAALAAGLASVMVPDLAPAPDEAHTRCLRVVSDLHEVRRWLDSGATDRA